jgi:hypothetical protein
MTSTARLARRLLVAALALAVLVSAAPNLAAASAGPPKHKTPSAPGKHKDAKKKHKKKKDTKKKKKRKKSTKPPARRPVAPQPEPQPQPQPTPEPPADPGPAQFSVQATGGYYFLYSEQWGTSSAKTEMKFNWQALGNADVSGATDTDFRITAARVSGFLTAYSFDRSSSFTTLDDDYTMASCARGYTETPALPQNTLNLSLTGTTASNVAVAVGDDSFDISTAATASGPAACASPPTGTFTRTFYVDGLKLGFQQVGGSNGATSCTTSGSLAAGFTRSCTATRFLGTTHMERWTMEVKLLPVAS